MSTRRQHTAHIYSTPMGDGSYYIENTQTGEHFTSRDVESIARYIRSYSQSPDHYPLGTFVHSALEKVGITRDCLPCAERQAYLDRLIRRPGG